MLLTRVLCTTNEKINCIDYSVFFFFFTDEYTKITTPRQDVLFKKGYLGRRKHTSVPVITEVINENEGSQQTTLRYYDNLRNEPQYNYVN